MFLQRLPVRSWILHSAGYDEVTKILELEFQTGVICHSLRIPHKICRNLVKSLSREDPAAVPGKAGRWQILPEHFLQGGHTVGKEPGHRDVALKFYPDGFTFPEKSDSSFPAADAE